MIDYAEIGDDGTWELFARDYLAELGFVVDVPPGRGPDQGRDLLISEQLTGRLRTEKFTWLVSCKYYTKSEKAVGTGDEVSITDRLVHHKADGFIGFYSTVASAALVDRLKQYRQDGHIKAYEIFDRKKIEAGFYGEGLSRLALRYFPLSYGRMRPLQKLIGDYLPLECEICGKDVLLASIERPYGANIAWSYSRENHRHYLDAHIVCKGNCDRELEERLWAQGQMSGWEDIGDLTNPLFFLRNLMTYTNHLQGRKYSYSDEAHAKMKHIYVAIAQRTLREITDEDSERFQETVLLDVF